MYTIMQTGVKNSAAVACFLQLPSSKMELSFSALSSVYTTNKERCCGQMKKELVLAAKLISRIDNMSLGGLI